MVVSDRTYFDDLVAQQGDFNPFADRGWRTLQRRFGEMADKGEKLRVLDVGCGTGNSRQIYQEHASCYLGLDISPRAVKAAALKYSESGWITGNALHLPIATESLDAVGFSSVLHHIDDREAALREARRVLKPGGMVFAFDPNLLHPAMALFRHPRSPLYSSEGVSPNEKPLYPSELRKSFEAAGLVVIAQRCQADIPYRHVAPKILNALLAAYNIGDRLMALSRLDRWFGSFVVTAARKAS